MNMQRAVINTPEGFEAMVIFRTNGSYCVRVNMMFVRAFSFIQTFLAIFKPCVPYATDGLQSTFVVDVPAEMADDFLDIVTEIYHRNRQ